MTTEISVSSHKLSLAREYLDDIELGRLAPENLLLKGIRVARLCGEGEIHQWLDYELSGFAADHPVSLKYMALTGRLTEQGKTSACWESFPQIDAQISLYKLQMQPSQIPGIIISQQSDDPRETVSGKRGRQGGRISPAADRTVEHLNQLNTEIIQRVGIRSRVLALLQDFASKNYYTLAFSSLQENLFERQKKLIEAQLGSILGSILEKVPDLYDRLAQAAPEAVSQAFMTCRQIIEVFTDSIYPPAEETIQIDGIELPVTADHFQNRIKAFLRRTCESSIRRQRLHRTFADLYSRGTFGGGPGRNRRRGALPISPDFYADRRDFVVERVRGRQKF